MTVTPLYDGSFPLKGWDEHRDPTERDSETDEAQGHENLVEPLVANDIKLFLEVMANGHTGETIEDGQLDERCQGGSKGNKEDS